MWIIRLALNRPRHNSSARWRDSAFASPYAASHRIRGHAFIEQRLVFKKEGLDAKVPSRVSSEDSLG